MLMHSTSQRGGEGGGHDGVAWNVDDFGTEPAARARAGYGGVSHRCHISFSAGSASSPLKLDAEPALNEIWC